MIKDKEMHLTIGKRKWYLLSDIFHMFIKLQTHVINVWPNNFDVQVFIMNTGESRLTTIVILIRKKLHTKTYKKESANVIDKKCPIITVNNFIFGKERTECSTLFCWYIEHVKILQCYEEMSQSHESWIVFLNHSHWNM